MSRKFRKDRSDWKMPKVYAFTGDYGPFKVNDQDLIQGDDCLVLLWKSSTPSSTDQNGNRRHPMYALAGEIQQLVLSNNSSSPFRNVLVVDIHDMFEHNNDCSTHASEKQDLQTQYEQEIAYEVAERDLVKGFGRTVVRVLQRLRLGKVTWAALEELCPVLLKFWKNLDSEAIITTTSLSSAEAANMWLCRPKMITATFVNTHLCLGVGLNVETRDCSSPTSITSLPEDDALGGGRDRRGRKKKQKRHSPPFTQSSFESVERRNNTSQVVSKTSKNPKNHGRVTGLNLHLVFEDEAARDKRLDIFRSAYPSGTTKLDGRKASIVALLSSDDGVVEYNPAYYNNMGQSLHLSEISVYMNPNTKQYERRFQDITADLLKIETSPRSDTIAVDTTVDLQNLNWSNCDRYVGALVLRGNRCVLVRSLSKAWDGMRIPCVVPKEGESPTDAAVRAVVEQVEVDASEVETLALVPPVAVYAPSGRPILMHLYPLYATAPPPESALEEQDMEDDETPYDWYTFQNAIQRLNDNRSAAALQTISSALIEAANVGIVPCKWGGVFGQELSTGSSGVALLPNSAFSCKKDQETEIDPFRPRLIANVEEWNAGNQSDPLRDVRKANAELMQRIARNTVPGGDDPKEIFKLPVTLLSGFLGSGKTTVMGHILANYHGLKVAILVNDMGEVNIDAALLKRRSISVTQSDEHMVELSNGCICCTLREDLLVEVAKIASKGIFDYLLIESSGISEPLPVAETFTFEDETGLRLSDIAHLDTLVSVVDVSRFFAELNSIELLLDRDWQADPEDQRTVSHLLCDQVEFANVIILNKCDLVQENEMERVKDLVRSMNKTAKIIGSVFGKVPLDTVMGTQLFSMSEAEKHDGWLKEARIGEHKPETEEYGIGSFTYRSRKPFLPHKLFGVIEAMVSATPPFDESRILRCKGFVWLANSMQIKGDFSLAGRHYSLLPGAPWWAAIAREHWPDGLEQAIEPLWHERFGDRQQEIVVIGQTLDENTISRVLDECLLSDSEVALDSSSCSEICHSAGDPFGFDCFDVSGDHHHHDHLDGVCEQGGCDHDRHTTN